MRTLIVPLLIGLVLTLPLASAVFHTDEPTIHVQSAAIAPANDAANALSHITGQPEANFDIWAAHLTRDAATECGFRPIPVPTESPDPGAPGVGANAAANAMLEPCTGIRPGAQIRTGGLCTMAWILTDGADFYGATAGHCASTGQNVRLAATNQIIGTMVYSVDQPIGEDFGIFKIRADREHLINPAMCHWGGAEGIYEPTGLPGPEPEDGEGAATIRHYGYGIGFGSTGPTRIRAGVFHYDNGEAFTFTGAASPGDSGSPARLADGRALGVITDLTTVRTPGTGPLVPSDAALLTGAAAGTLLSHGLDRVLEATGLDLTLVEAPVANEPL